ncbi:MAG: VOC family protein [Myxococcota bacterium]
MNALDHVALVVEDLETTLHTLREIPGVPIGPIQEFPDEGTREVYLGEERQAALLLMQPLNTDGPYAQALAKCGPGLHHIALHVPSVELMLEQLAGSGWYLHLQSISTLRRHRTVWLARPGVGVLVELHESQNQRTKPALVTQVEVPVHGPAKPLFEALRLTDVTTSPDRFAWIAVLHARLRTDQLCTRDPTTLKS